MTQEIVAKYMQELDDDKIQNIEKILVEVTQIIVKNPDYYAAYILRGRLYIRQNQHQEAYDDFSKSILINPKNYDGFFFRAHVLLLMKKTSDGITDINKAIEINNDKSQAYFVRGQLQFEMMQYKDALNDYTKAIELDPKYADAYKNLGLAFYNQNKLDDAIKDYTKAIELNPRYANAYHSRGLAFYNQNKLDDAIKDYTKAIELNPNDADSYNNRGNAFYNQNKLDDAIKDYTKAIELNPNDADSYNNRGLAFYNYNKLDDAIKDYTKAIELKPNHPLYLSNIGQSYISNNQLELAQLYIKKAQNVIDSTDQQQLIKQYKLCQGNINHIKSTLLLLSEISNRLKEILINIKQLKKQNTITDEEKKQLLKFQNLWKKLKIKIKSYIINHFANAFQHIQKPVDQQKLVFSKLIMIKHLKPNRKTQLVAPLFGGVPLVGSALEKLFQLFDFGVQQYKKKQFNDKIQNIMAVIKFNSSTPQQEFQLATFESIDNITEKDLNINDLEYYDQVQEIIQIEKTQNEDAQNMYWQLGVYHCIIVLKYIERESKLLTADKNSSLRNIILQGMKMRQKKNIAQKTTNEESQKELYKLQVLQMLDILTQKQFIHQKLLLLQLDYKLLNFQNGV